MLCTLYFMSVAPKLPGSDAPAVDHVVGCCLAAHCDARRHAQSIRIIQDIEEVVPSTAMWLSPGYVYPQRTIRIYRHPAPSATCSQQSTVATHAIETSLSLESSQPAFKAGSGTGRRLGCGGRRATSCYKKLYAAEISFGHVRHCSPLLRSLLLCCRSSLVSGYLSFTCIWHNT